LLVTDLQRPIRNLRISRAVDLAAAVLLAVVASNLAAYSLGAAFALAVPVAILLTAVVVQTSTIRRWKAEERAARLELAGQVARDVPEALAALAAAVEASKARLAAAPAPCAHPDAEPVDLSTGERVAWVCANPECGAELPAGWAPPAQVTGTLTASGGALSVTAALSGTGSLSARARVTGQACECPAGTSSAEVHAPGSAGPVARYCLSCGRHRLAVAEQRDYRGVWSTGGSGRCLCPACQQSMREARGRLSAVVAAEHFAALARVDRERCIGFCPICAERDHR
jgi:hypothetical protein